MKYVLCLFLAGVLSFSPLWDVPVTGFALSGAVWADDDDDGDDDDDDDDDDNDGARGGSRSGGASGRAGGGSDGGARLLRGDGNDPVSRWLRRLIEGEPAQSRTVRPRPPAAPQTSPRPVQRLVPETREPDEVLTFELSLEDLAELLAVGFSVIETGALVGLGVTFHRLSIAPDLNLPDALAQVRALPSGQISDFNHFYRTEQAPPVCNTEQCAAARQIGWPDPRECAPVAPIGVIDTPVNTEHALLADAWIETVRTTSQDTDPASAMHGTAVAALLVAGPDRGFRGLVPSARIIAVDAFHRVGRDERADTLALIRGLSVLSERGVKTINFSLAGPANVVLETTVERLARNDALLVAAAGNGGPGAPAVYPGAYPSVIAVTAVDGEDRIFRRAQRGAHVELSAPGVDVWTAASISGLRRKTGTSFAVPFVTAALAQARADAPGLSASALRRTLAARARDLGEPGPDPTFGRGLLSARGLCGTAQLLPASAPAENEYQNPIASE